MSKATSRYFSDREERPFVITRSTHSGVGKYVSHWLGDNFSRWDMLKHSVAGIYLFQMYGVPIVGADICGFIGDTNPSLCARWYAVGAFYPFSRNHNDKDSISQEPYTEMFLNRTIAGLQNVTYTDFIRETALKRYALHRYHYSYVHKSSTDGVPYFTPVFYRYPDEDEAYKRVEQNILIGESVKVSPVLDNVTSTTTFYFPGKNTQWCPIWPKYQLGCFKGQSQQIILLPEDEVFVHIKSGSIILLQLGDLKEVPNQLNLEGLSNLPVDLAIHPDSKYTAAGWARYDDGITQDLSRYTEFTFSATGANSIIPFSTAYLDVDINIAKDDSLSKGTKNQNLGSVVIYNSGVINLGTESKCKIDFTTGESVTFKADYNSDTKIARFHVLTEGGYKLREITHIKITSK
jgi:alpha-glucosidase